MRSLTVYVYNANRTEFSKRKGEYLYEKNLGNMSAASGIIGGCLRYKKYTGACESDSGADSNNRTNSHTGTDSYTGSYQHTKADGYTKANNTNRSV